MRKLTYKAIKTKIISAIQGINLRFIALHSRHSFFTSQLFILTKRISALTVIRTLLEY